MKCRAKANHAVERIYKSRQKIYRQLTFFAQHHLQTLMRKDFRMIDQLQEVPTSDISLTGQTAIAQMFEVKRSARSKLCNIDVNKLPFSHTYEVIQMLGTHKSTSHKDLKSEPN